MKTRRFLGLVALATLTLGGCSNDEVVNDYSQDNAIEFGTYMGRDVNSRASIYTTEDLQAKDAGFGVYAYYTDQTEWENYDASKGPNFMNNTHVTYTAGADGAEGKWTYSPLKYWPNNPGDKISFFAYAPYSADNTNISNVVNGKVAFTVPNTIEDQTDLTAVTDHKINQTKGNLDQVVEFEFKHVLSRIDFTLQAAADQVAAGGTINEGTTITLNSITIGGTKEGEGGFYTDGVYSILDNTWNEEKGNQAFTLEVEDFIEESNILTEGEDGNNQRPLIEETGDQHIMIIPQECYNLPITVNYTVKTEGINDAGEADNSEITNVITSYVKGIIFEPNKIFKIHIVLGMSTVELAATVADWNGGEHNEIVNLPLNKE